jgi:hypothetical protein
VVPTVDLGAAILIAAGIVAALCLPASQPLGVAEPSVAAPQSAR